MGEQNRRAVEVERSPGKTAPPPDAGFRRTPERAPDDDRALGVEADERQTQRQAPDGASPGEGGQDDSVG